MYLEVFDRASEQLVSDYLIEGIELAALKELIKIDPAIEQYGCDVSIDDVPIIAAYVSDPVVVNLGFLYQIDFYREQ
ncbi:DUF7683 domain-containing protein [Antrihabitans cavernicola]|uniref:DUF7683 domain-containing protein n=1 Tax=Antrihabitans cavernicola TaxID=2495913 RepID=A0A5A7SEL9_9NOCA|nr:hypothetical protein [Spelaeibacter cavernicola]KAA0024538.1 hypothetical protein FOY51_00820 [Spelaeibacter cavernicola]